MHVAIGQCTCKQQLPTTKASHAVFIHVQHLLKGAQTSNGGSDSELKEGALCFKAVLESLT